MAEQASSSKDSKTVEVALAPKAIKRKNTSPPELQTPSKRTTEQASSQGERIEDVFQDEILKAFADITSFKQFARSKSGLCLDQSYIKTIVEDHKSNVEEQKLELLFKWREIEGDEASVIKIRSLLQSYRERDIQEGRVVDVFQDEIIRAFSNIAGFMKFARSGYGLCLDEHDLQNIVAKHENNVEEQKMKMLFQWKTNSGNEASVLRIRSLLQSYRERDIQEVAREVTVNTAVPNNQTTRVADSNTDSVDVRLSGGTQPQPAISSIQGGKCQYDEGLSRTKDLTRFSNSSEDLGIPLDWIKDQIYEFDVEEYDDYGNNMDEKSNSDYSEEEIPGIPSDWIRDQDQEYDIEEYTGEEYNSEEEDDGY